MDASKKPTFRDLERLARERAYTVRRRGKEISWWRNEDTGRVLVTHGVGSTIQEILMDCSSKKHLERGTNTTQENNHEHERKDDRRSDLAQGTC